MNQAAVLIGTMGVGPTCARKAGLIELAKRKTGLVFPVQRRQIQKPDQPQTLDLFDEVNA